MGNKLLTNNFNPHSELNRYGSIDKGPQKQWFDNSLQQNDESKWANVTDENLYYRTQYGKFSLYRNSITLQEVQKYQILLKNRDHFNKFSNLIKWRNNCHYLPKVEHFIIQNKTQICVSQFQVNLFIERIPLRLSDLTDIPFPQNLYFMTAMLKGFKYIFGSSFNAKMFKPTQSMIGVNREGQVKVWWSENLSALESVERNQVFISEQDFVNKVINMVEQNTDQREYHYPFKRYLSQRSIPINGDFNFVINQIYNYAKQMKVIIPKYAFSVREILTRDMFQNTRIYSENSLTSNNFQTVNKQMQRQEGRIQNNSAQTFNRNQILITSNQNMYGHSYSENISNDNIRSTGQFKNNQGHGLMNINNSGSVERHNARENNFDRHPIIIQRNSENKINQGIYQMGNNRVLSNQKVNFSINSNYSFNKLKRNIAQFPNKTFEPHHNIASQIKQKRHSDIHFNNQPVVRSNTVQFKNPQIIENSNLVKIPRQNNSGIVFNQNKNNSVFFNTAQHSHFINNPPLNTEILPQSRNRYNSYHIPSTYQNQNPPPLSHMLHQNSTPVFPQPLRPQQLSTRVLIQRSNRAPSSSISQNSHINQLPKQQKIPSQQNYSKAPLINDSIANSPDQTLKLKYFTKKDSQQTMDPQIVADLAKYLNPT